MNKTYFTPITSEVKYAGCVIMQTSGKTPVVPPIPVEPTAPARKLYV